MRKHHGGESKRYKERVWRNYAPHKSQPYGRAGGSSVKAFHNKGVFITSRRTPIHPLLLSTNRNRVFASDGHHTILPPSSAEDEAGLQGSPAAGHINAVCSSWNSPFYTDAGSLGNDADLLVARSISDAAVFHRDC